MKTQLIASLRAIALFSLLLGVGYPLITTVIAQVTFSDQALGSLLQRDGKVVGSSLIAQKNGNPRYFQTRPSAVDFATVPSGASNAAPTSKVFREAVEKRVTGAGEPAPADLLTASGSGLDPHISPAAALFQIGRIVRERNLSPNQRGQLKDLIRERTEHSTWGVLGQSRVNVLELNLALDERFK